MGTLQDIIGHYLRRDKRRRHTRNWNRKLPGIKKILYFKIIDGGTQDRRLPQCIGKSVRIAAARMVPVLEILHAETLFEKYRSP